MKKLEYIAAVYLVSWALAPALCAAGVFFRRGDANQDASVDISDCVKVLNTLFLGGPRPGCDDALDLNDDGRIDISDGISGLTFLFGSGGPPPKPFPDCGTDDTDDSLDCASYSQCCLSDEVAVVSVLVKNTDNLPPPKGDALRITLRLQNNANRSGLVTATPRLRSKRFHDFNEVPFASTDVALGAGETRDVTVERGPFLEDTDRKKQYAIGRGGYAVSSVRLECPGGPAATQVNFTGKDFIVGPSETVFTAVVYDPRYFAKIRYTAGAEKYMVQAFTRPCEVFTPNAPGSSTGTYESFPGGFDEMMRIRQIFRVFPGFPATSSAGGFCEQADAYARKVLGLTRDWDIGSQATDPDHHGFDILVGLTQEFGGGATCGWLGTQISGLFDFDLSLKRSQIIAVHEMGHIFGAPHCDPLQGYVMCAGEKHAHYVQQGIFVWHKESLDAMANPYD
jgi:hypothetical protein